MARFTQQTFEDQAVHIDGNEYDRCTFRRCVLHVAAGPEGGTLLSNTFDDCRWQFEGGAARTIEFLKSMVTHLGFRDVVEETCRAILALPDQRTTGKTTFKTRPSNGGKLDA